MSKYTNIKVKKLPNSEVEIEATLPYEELAKHRASAIKHLNEHIDLPGFRKGKIPENILVAKVGEQAIIEEAAEMAFGDIYSEILLTEKIEALGRPNVSITKLAKDNPVEFKIKVSVMPRVLLGDFKKAAKKENSKKSAEIKVEDKEIEDVINQIQNSRKGEAKEPPVFDDSFVKTLGDFKDVTDFKVKAKESIFAEKVRKEKEKKRIEMAEEIIKSSEIEMPVILVESEVEKMWHQLSDDVTRMGLKVEDYLKHLKKTEEELRKEWRPDAEKRAKFQLILNQIAVEEKVKPDEKMVEEEVNHLIEHYPKADPIRARVYVETLLTNEKVFEFLEGLK